MRTIIQSKERTPVVVDLNGYDRIRSASTEKSNQRIEKRIENEVRECAAEDPEVLGRRIEELDREWDVDRAAMLFFSIVGGTVLSLGLTKNQKILRLMAIQLPFLALHAIAGWCPPAAVMRRLGFRSRSEIDAEKYALKTLRGDFRLH